MSSVHPVATNSRCTVFEAAFLWLQRKHFAEPDKVHVVVNVVSNVCFAASVELVAYSVVARNVDDGCLAVWVKRALLGFAIVKPESGSDVSAPQLVRRQARLAFLVSDATWLITCADSWGDYVEVKAFFFGAWGGSGMQYYVRLC